MENPKPWIGFNVYIAYIFTVILHFWVFFFFLLQGPVGPQGTDGERGVDGEKVLQLW